jgi:hypothetical protein
MIFEMNLNYFEKEKSASEQEEVNNSKGEKDKFNNLQ